MDNTSADPLLTRLGMLDPAIPAERAADMVRRADVMALADAFNLPRALLRSDLQALAAEQHIVIDLWLTWDHGFTTSEVSKRLHRILDAIGIPLT